MILASQNIEDFLLPSIREFTKPLFSIPTHQFLFNAGLINPKEYIDALQIEPSEFELIRYPERGTCLYRCGNERYLLEVIAPGYKAELFGSGGEGNGGTDNPYTQKIGTAVLSNKKGRKVVGGIILGSLVLLMMPAAVMLGIFSGSMDINTDGVQTIVKDRQKTEEKRYAEIEQAMTEAGYSEIKIREAQAIYSFALF